MIEMSGEILLLMSHWLRAGLRRLDAARFVVTIRMLVIKILMVVRLVVGKFCVEVLACCKKDEDGEKVYMLGKPPINRMGKPF